MTEDGKETAKPVLAIITGLSGAGKSTAMKALEDLTFHCMDNIPADLLEPTIKYFLSLAPKQTRFAIGLDIRSVDSIIKFKNLKPKLDSEVETELLFFDCDREVLAQRYSTTRRKHPLIASSGDLMSAIAQEITLLRPLKSEAHAVFDTSHWSPHHLTRALENHFSYAVKGRALYVTVTSFGFKNGALHSYESIYDARFLKNPYFVPGLKNKTGLEKEVEDYVLADPNAQEFLQRLIDMHQFLLPNYYREGKHYFRIGIGCTGGMHRSVVMAENLVKALNALNLPNVVVNATHRDIHMTQTY